MEEPYMLIQRPSTAQTQRSSHILVSTFRDIFSKDSLDDDTIKHLSTSNCEERGIHSLYVDRLAKVQQKWEQMVADVEKVKQHITDSSKQARELEKLELEDTAAKYPQYEQLGLPPVPSKLASCLDASYLKSYNLVIPQDILSYQDVPRHEGKATMSEEDPQYAKMTISQSYFHSKEQVDDNFAPEKGPTLPAYELHKSSRTALKSKSSKTRSNKTRVQSPGETESKNVWRESMKPNQREIEKKDLSNLQSRADYLKNPRFETEVSSTLLKVSKEKSRLCAHEFFQPSHSPIVFTDYEVGKAYTIPLCLKNVTSSCRKLRVLPLTTNYFSVSIGESPAENGLVAPGMDCVYNVTFTPDTLADYDDELKVITQADQPLVIPIIARRQSPSLTLGEYIDCGHCLVGGTKQMEILCQNNGGDGAFILTSEDEPTPASNWEKVSDKARDDVLSVDAFSFEPASFYLNAGESIVVKVKFHPVVVKSYSTSLKMYCDNCTMKTLQLSGSGELASVHLSEVDGECVDRCSTDQYLAADYEARDVTAHHLLRFTDQHPNVVSSKILTVSNDSFVSLKYKWVISLLQTDREDQDTPKALEHSVFSLSDMQGSLVGKSKTSFRISFMPENLGEFSAVACLKLLQIPDHSDESLQEMNAIKIELKGNAQPHTVTIDPCLQIAPNDVHIGITKHYDVNVKNEGFSEVHTSWKAPSNENFHVDFFPQSVVIGVGESHLCTVSVTGKQKGQFDIFCPLEIPFNKQQQGFNLKTRFCAPTVTFRETCLDFGLLQFRRCGSERINIENKSPVPAAWRISEQNFKNSNQTSPFSFLPDKGVLEANSCQEIQVELKSSSPCMIETYFLCEVYNSDPCYLQVSADIQRPKVCLSNSTLVYEEAFVDVPCVQTIELVNETLLGTNFQWKEVLGGDSASASLKFLPATGSIGPHERVIIQVEFTGSTQGQLTDIICVCEVSEMLDPIIMAVSANVKGLEYKIRLPSMQDIENENDNVSELDCLEFGYNNILGENPHTLMILENCSAIASQFSLSLENFPSAVLNAEGKSHGRIASGGKKPLLKKTVNISDYSAKTTKQADEDKRSNILKNGKGAAFVCSPSSGTLEPFGQQVIRITAYSDMWGEYIDNLVCKVGELPVTRVPVHIDVIGSPMNFQMTKDQPPVVRFGSHMSGSEVVSRNMRINNTSHCDIRLDWQSFVLDLDDEQMIDLNVFVGQLFPELDMNGNEVSEDDAEGEPLIKVFLLEHQGMQSTQPFSISPSQVVIPAKGQSTVQAHFKPHSNSSEPVDFLGYGLGYMSLKPKYKKCLGQFSRCDGLDMLPFALNMTGSVRPAELHLETCDDNGFLYELAASDLLNRETGQIRKTSITKTHRYVLVNNGQTAVSFQCIVNEPFKVQQLSESPRKKNKHDSCTLKPGRNIELKVSLTLPKETVLSLPIEETIATFHENLIIKFSNNTEQTYLLNGRVFFPNLVLSSDEVNFGECFAGERQQLYVTLKNTSLSASSWKAEFDPACPSASKSVFSLSAMSGQLEGSTSNVSRDTTELFVYFTPKHNLKYECTLMISGLLNEPLLRLKLYGSGSYDETAKEKNQFSI